MTYGDQDGPERSSSGQWAAGSPDHGNEQPSQQDPARRCRDDTHSLNWKALLVTVALVLQTLGIGAAATTSRTAADNSDQLSDDLDRTRRQLQAVEELSGTASEVGKTCEATTKKLGELPGESAPPKPRG